MTPGPADAPCDTLLEAVRWVCVYYGLNVSEAALRTGLPRGAWLSPQLAVRILEQVGISSAWAHRDLAELSSYLFPVVLQCRNGRVCVVTIRRGEGPAALYEVVFMELVGRVTVLTAKELADMYSGYALLIKPRPQLDDRAGEPLPEQDGHWLFGTVWHYRRYYTSAALGAILINVLTLASTFFTMNAYDRVIPNQAYVTLWSLAIGVMLAMLFEFVARHVRAHLVDVAGKKADLVLGTLLFRKVMATCMEYRPPSAGAFANQLREFESVRDFVSSATLTTISDLPFCIAFVAIIAVIGGPLSLVLVASIPIIIIVSIAIQGPLARTMQENLREASLKQGLLIEVVEGMESLKAVHGEGVMQMKWENFSALTAASAMKSRAMSSLAINFVTWMQQMQTVVIVVWGVYLIHDGALSTGALIGSVILASRAVSPLAAVVGLAVRFQQARAALRSLNRLVALPVDRVPGRRYLARQHFTGDIELKGIGFAYPVPPGQTAPRVLQDISLHIGAGERVAVLGNIGSGKSTLLRVMAALFRAQDGQLLFDDIDAGQIDPADVRAAVGLLSQDARLFHGTLRDNVMIGNPSCGTERFLEVARLTGVDQIAAHHPRGFDMPVGEMGEGLSGGQRQLVALARCLLLEPRILLMDEPTSSMDLQTELHFLHRLSAASKGQTLVVATHRLSVLNLVERVVVLNEGRVHLDGPKDAVLRELGIVALPVQGHAPAPPARGAA